ncbi:MAG: family 1 glycosylhydrolase [Deltaproteobacteria bacterium]|jgi:beta-glucosidase|nr:family 1 glycosylhydrolase [Deltaproteobacteria bacterium]MBW2536797.1 family 1 glycosylhydrolase [Deltaproteobacteria bacterium]
MCRARRAARGSWLFALAPWLATGCSDSSDPAASPPPPEIPFAEPGSVAAGSGAESFRFGAASAATQIEDGNEHTDWYLWTLPEADGGLGQGEQFVGDGSMGYTRALDDISLVTDLHLDSYRFSIEWARIEPERDVIDEEALAHYDELIDGLIAAGVKPMITVHHFSNPRWVDDPLDVDCDQGPSDQNLCGYGHPTGGPEIIDEMAEHAALLAERFGDRVDEWGTVNEPLNYLLASHGIGYFPPGKTKVFDLLDELLPAVFDYMRAHAAMYRALKDHDTVDADGDGIEAAVGLTMAAGYWEAARDNEPSDHPEDVAGRDRLEYVYNYLFVDALRAAELDTDLDGTLDTPAPELADSLDWLGVQYYFRAGVTGQNGVLPVIEVSPCVGTFDLGSCLPPTDPTFCVPTMRYEYFPAGLYHVLERYGARWPDLPLTVTEAGLATEVGARRAEHVVRTLEQIERARSEGVDVRGYYYWSLTDNFEWHEGYAPRFGLYRVDYATYERSPTEGADVLRAIAGDRLLSSAQRQTYGGEGPLTPEDPDAPPAERCNY